MFNQNDSLEKSIDISRLEGESIGSIGLEKESLRMIGQDISQNSHKKYLGKALFNNYITKDFAEAQTELVTPPSSNKDELIEFLDCLHGFVLSKIENEYFWPFSIPNSNSLSREIKIAEFGNSNKGTLKKIYREGLALRYGKPMQIISGIHFNYSFNDKFWNLLSVSKKDGKIRDEIYFRAIRNVQRYNWFILYFFGCSPILGKELINDSLNFRKFNPDEYQLCDATSLRMSSMGYQDIEQSKLHMANQNLESYISSIYNACNIHSSKFAKLTKNKTNKLKQLNENILQIEDEYYGVCRPKSKLNNKFRQLSNLSSNGIDYIELRSLDLNPFSPRGIERKDINFIEAFLIYCTLSASPEFTEETLNEALDNNENVSCFGRSKTLSIHDNGKAVKFPERAKLLLNEINELVIKPLAIDVNIADYTNQIDDPGMTISGRLLNKIREENISFSNLGEKIGKENKTRFLNNTLLSKDVQKTLKMEIDRSNNFTSRIEEDDDLNFEAFLKEYLTIQNQE